VVADSSAAADGLSTALFVAGMDRGLELIKECSGAEAVFINEGLSIYVTSGLRDCFMAACGVSVDII
jgi:thiamine biosynthesis lipoprotein